MKQKIVAIGGGDFKSYQTLSIDKEIVKMSEKIHPKFLFILTASSDNAKYAKTITQYFKDLECETDILNFFNMN